MKKVLLSIAVAFMAMTASAQQFMPAASHPISLDRHLQIKKSNIPFVGDADATVKQFMVSEAKAKGMKKAPELSTLYGDYVEDGYEEIHTATSAQISALDLTDDSGNHYNVEVKLFNGYIDVAGNYEGDSIVIPSQYCYEVTSDDDDLYEEFGACYFQLCNFNLDATGNVSKSSTYDYSNIVFTVNDDGSLMLRNDGYYIALVNSTSEYNGVSYNINVTLFPNNATQTFYMAGDDGWGSYTFGAAVEDGGDYVGVYDFCTFGGYVGMTINDDLTVTMDTGQTICATTSEIQEAGGGDYLTLVGMALTEDEDGGHISFDWDVEEITGVIEGDSIIFTEYYGIAGDPLYDDSGEYMGAYGAYMYGYKVVLTSGHFEATGIKEVSATREEQIRSTKTYNLMGQQVNRDTAKGLLIRGGRKYIKK